MNIPIILDYLSSLEQNNNREWFHANKAQYQAANLEFEGMIEALMHMLRQNGEDIPFFTPKELTFKLQRDTRFSHDKSPYNPSFRAHIGGKGKLPIPVGYYLLLQPGNRSFLGGGLFPDMFKEATAMVRDAIVRNGEEWEHIITTPAFAECFTVAGTKLKKVPQGYDPSHPQAEYLKHKSWYLELPVSDKCLADPHFLEFAVDRFQRMRPFHRFLNRALEDFQMPKRPG